MEIKKHTKRAFAAILAVSTLSSAVSAINAMADENSVPVLSESTSEMTQMLTASSVVSVTESNGYAEGAYAKWAAVDGADGYNVYCDGVQLDSMLIRQYKDGSFRADAVGITAGNHTLKIVPTKNGSEMASSAAEVNVSSYAHDRSGYAFNDGHMPGAYKADGTLKDNAIVVYVTEENKDSVTVKLNAEGKGEVDCVGIQNIVTAYKKGKETRPIAIRLIGNISDPANMPKGDLMVDTVTSAGMTIEGIGADATANGWGIVLKNCVDVEVRNVGTMNCNSSEGDNIGLQQGDSYCWVHNCDFFYGDAGSDADQVKGDGALDTKKSHHITHSYNHFYDNGKCNLQGANSSDTSNYITYHHNWYDHSDSRHPRVRVATVHVYNNYYDGNAKYGIGSTTDSDIFAENNYFRNCKNPMMLSGQGTDAAGEGTFSGEVGGMIKAYGNVFDGGTYVPYSKNNTQFDFYDASSRNEQVPASVKAASGGAGYNNFDTQSDFYKYTVDKAEDVPTVVMSKAGRVNGGDFKWEFNDAVDDESYAVNAELKAALVAYDDTIAAIGSGFTSGGSVTTTPTVTTATTTVTTQKTSSNTTVTTVSSNPITTTDAPTEGDLFCAPNAKGSGKSKDDPMDVLAAISSISAGHTIYLLEGTYEFDSMILIDESNSGSAGAYKTIKSYNNADVTFDFSKQGAANGSLRGITLDGDYWHFYGFEITKAADNGMLLSGNNNLIEMMVFNDNQDTGLQISRYNTSAASIADWPSYNTILNCTSKNNCDDATMENADGFAAKLTCGEGNVFDGCMAYCNSDDGWDLFAKTETGPIGVVTLQNCVAFRNGFTEFGEGYGDCDGNGFKLGGSGVGSAHVVKNCLAFENLNCGFTDNNNPKLESLTDCTAYNNGVGGNGKSNYMTYRCTDDGCDFKNLVSYTNIDKVSNTGAAGIKVSNDKMVGTIENSIYYNSKYYYIKDKINIANGDKNNGDVITPAESDFITLSVPAMGTDFHTAWRNADGSVYTGGFAETTGQYESMGYHFVKGSGPIVTQTQPTVTSESSKSTTSSKTTETTVSSSNVPVAGDVIHNFTENGINSTFFTIAGNLSTSKGTVNYDGKTLTQCLKMESATSIKFTNDADGKITLVFVEPAATIKVDGVNYTANGDGIITVDVAAGSHEIKKADSANLFYMVYGNNGSVGTTTSKTDAPPVSSETTTNTTATTNSTSSSDTTTKTTGQIPSDVKYGDINLDDSIGVIDVIYLNKYLASIISLNEQQIKNADCVFDGIINSSDSSTLMKYTVSKIDSLPVQP